MPETWVFDLGHMFSTTLSALTIAALGFVVAEALYLLACIVLFTRGARSRTLRRQRDT